MRKNVAINKINGFTLVEMLVSLAIFVIVLAIVGSTYMTFVKKQREQLGQQNVQQDIQNFFDTLEREIRTGFGDTVVVNSSGSLTFYNQEKVSVTYMQAGGKIKRREFGGSADTITSDRTWIDQFKFIVPSASVKTTDSGGNSYLTGMATRITVLIKACVDKAGNSCFSTQTSLSVRQLTPYTP